MLGTAARGHWRPTVGTAVVAILRKDNMVLDTANLGVVEQRANYVDLKIAILGKARSIRTVLLHNCISNLQAP